MKLLLDFRDTSTGKKGKRKTVKTGKKIGGLKKRKEKKKEVKKKGGEKAVEPPILISGYATVCPYL